MMPESVSDSILIIRDSAWCPRPAGKLAERILAEFPSMDEKLHACLLGRVIEDVWAAGVNEGLALAAQRLTALVFKR